MNTLRSCRGENNFNPLVILVAQNYLVVQNHFGHAQLFWSCKIISVVQNSELGSPSHNTSTLCQMSTQTSVQKSSHVSSPKTIKCDLNYYMLLLLLIVTLLSQRIPCSPFPRDANRRNHQECFNQMTLLLDSGFLDVFATIAWWAVECTLPTIAALPSTNRLHSTLELHTYM